jgi:hypothetical protein
MHTATQHFPLAPLGGSVLYWVFALVPVGLVVLAGFFFWAAWSTRQVTIDVTADEVVIHGGIYGRTIPRASLDTKHARIVEGLSTSDLKPVRRTNGLGLPNFRSGWFTLANKEKALLFVSSERAVYVPTDAGYALLVTPADPEAFLAAIE